MFLQHTKIYRNADAGAAGGAGDAGAEKPWFDAFDPETKGYVQNKGLDKKTAVEAFLEASKFHREAEKFVGAPASELVRLPKEAGAPEWEKVHQRLGKPAEKKEYDFSGVKVGDNAIDDATVDTLRQWAWDSNMSKDSALRMAHNYAKHKEASAVADAAIRADKLSVEIADLKKNWGHNEAANLVVAKNAVKALGVDPVAVAALEGQVGYAKVMEMFRNIGSKIGEDSLVIGSGGGGNRIMSSDQAEAEKKELMRDVAWRERYLKGGVEEIRKMTALNRIITNTTS